jgi:hypothetical protein
VLVYKVSLYVVIRIRVCTDACILTERTTPRELLKLLIPHIRVATDTALAHNILQTPKTSAARGVKSDSKIRSEVRRT